MCHWLVSEKSEKGLLSITRQNIFFHRTIFPELIKYVFNTVMRKSCVQDRNIICITVDAINLIFLILFNKSMDRRNMTVIMLKRR